MIKSSLIIPTLTITTLGVLILGGVMISGKGEEIIETKKTTFTTQQVITVSGSTETITTIDPNTCMTTEIPACKKRFWKDFDATTCKEVTFEVDCMFYDEVSTNQQEYSKLLSEYGLVGREETSIACDAQLLDTVTTYGYACEEKDLGRTIPDTNTKGMCSDNSRTCRKAIRDGKEVLLREKNLATRYDPNGKTEICDGHDNDCDGLVDEGYQQKEYLRDFDGDGWGNIEMKTKACFPPPGHVLKPGDCDDLDKEIYPGAYEVCDGIDNNCNSQIDENKVCELDGLGEGSCSIEAIEIAKKNISKALSQCKQAKQKPTLVSDYKKFGNWPLGWESETGYKIVNKKAIDPLHYIILSKIYNNLSFAKIKYQGQYITKMQNLRNFFMMDSLNQFKKYGYENIDIIVEKNVVKVYKIRTFIRDELVYSLTFEDDGLNAKRGLEAFILFFNLLKSNNVYINFNSFDEGLKILHSKDHKGVYKLLLAVVPNVGIGLNKGKNLNGQNIIDDIKEYIDESLGNIGEDQKVCFTSCVTNHLLDYVDDTNNKDISGVINDGKGNCVNYQQVGEYIGNKMGLKIGIVDGYTFQRDQVKLEMQSKPKFSTIDQLNLDGGGGLHAFNWVEINKVKYLFDPLYGSETVVEIDSNGNEISSQTYEVKQCRITKFLE